MKKKNEYLSLASAAVVALALSLSTGIAKADEDFGGLPEGEGQELTFYACQGCHSLMTVTNQRFSRRVWDEVLDWMVDEQGMAELPDEDREVILDYLSTHLGIEG